MKARETILFFLIMGFGSSSTRAQAPDATPPSPRAGQSSAMLQIPRVSAPPKLEQFLGMRPEASLESQFIKVTSFTQERPKDGEPASQRTEAYLGYDDLHLYVIFVSFDSEPGKIRARLTKRENAFNDDFVEVTLDTFSDHRRGYVFWSNALGVQAEARWNEDRGGPDFSFDTLWYSRGQLTEKGYVVWMAIPWKSLRFPSVPEQSWGITLLRVIPRVNEWSYWPHVSSRIDGRLNQAGTAKGLENVSPGRNLQFIPYGVFRSFRALDDRDRDRPRFVSRRADSDGGLDTKIVIQDRFVLDLALNPDFSQVESDEPQVTVNQRFEVFFPEKRPFFLFPPQLVP